MLTPDQAWQTVCQAIRPLEARAIELEAALGYYLAAPIRADRDIPPADRAAMDGFAVRAADLAAIPARLRIVGEAAAGDPTSRRIGPGECLRIFTGANIPPGADAVVPVEDTTLGRFRDEPTGDEATITAAMAAGANIFRRAENARAGQELVSVGACLGPRQLAVAAACGYGAVEAHNRPRVAILTTGAELLAAGAAVSGDHEIRDSNGPMIAAACRGENFPIALRKPVPDDLGATCEAIGQAASKADVVVITGGVSAGQYDFVRIALDTLGAAVPYHGVAMKPGRPQLFAVLGGRTLVFGLPGNPLSATVGLYEFVLPALRRLAGCPAAVCRPVLHLALAEPLPCKGSYLRLVPARLSAGVDGTRVIGLKTVGTADLVSGGLADGAILAPAGAKMIETGSMVAFRPWRSPE